MTKKSAGRLARDAAKEQLQDNKCWDELNRIHESAHVMLYQHAGLHAVASDKRLQSCLENPSSTANSISILSRDLKMLNDQLSAIYAKHAGKTGGSQDPDEVWGSIMIGQEYAQLMETHTSVVQPTALKIVEDFQHAENVLARRLQEIGNQHTGAEVAQSAPTQH